MCTKAKKYHNASFYIWETHTWVHCLLSFFHLMMMMTTIEVSGLFSFLESLLHSSEVFHLSLLAFFFHYHFHHFLLLRCHPPAKGVDSQCIFQQTIIYQSSIITGFLLIFKNKLQFSLDTSLKIQIKPQCLHHSFCNSSNN